MQKENKPLNLEEMLRFLFVLALFGALLAALTTTRPDMTVLQREVGRHTVFVLNVMGARSELEEVYVRVPDQVTNKPEVLRKLRGLGLAEKQSEFGTAEYAAHLHPDLEKIVTEYVSNLQKNGEPVFLSKSVVSLSDKNFDVEIIPECTGLFGFMAISALIIGYPRASWRKKGIGVLVALPLMHVVNVLRLSTSIYSAYSAGVSTFYFTHDILWKTVLLAFAFIFWIIWIKWIVQEKV